MREIKFRAWDVDNSKMLIYHPHMSFHPFWMTPHGSIYREGILQNYILQQFTGLLDKNGVEIYEGDVLEVTDSSGFVKRKVVIHSIDHEQNYRADRNLPGREVFLSAWGMQDSQGGFEAFIHINRPCDYATVIGNIYENPELVELPATRVTGS